MSLVSAAIQECKMPENELVKLKSGLVQNIGMASLVKAPKQLV